MTSHQGIIIKFPMEETIAIFSGKIINMKVLFREVLTFLLFPAIAPQMSPLVDIIINQN